MAGSKKTSKKSNIPMLSAVELDHSITEQETADINDLFANAIKRHKKEYNSDKKQKDMEIEHLALIAEEYLSTFVLMGYSLQDEKVVIFNAPTIKDEAALMDLFRATFVDIIQNRP